MRTTTASTATDVAEIAARQASAAKQLQDDIRAVVATDAGHRLVWRWLGWLELRMVPNEYSARVHEHNGKRRVGLRIEAEVLEACPDFYGAEARAQRARWSMDDDD